MKHYQVQKDSENIVEKKAHRRYKSWKHGSYTQKLNVAMITSTSGDNCWLLEEDVHFSFRSVVHEHVGNINLSKKIMFLKRETISQNGHILE